MSREPNIDASRSISSVGDWRWGLGLSAIVFLAFLPSLNGEFITDDHNYITLNEPVQTWGGLPTIWFTLEMPQYYPLTFTSFWIEHKIWGLNPRGYHVVNVLLHIANALLLWRVCRRLGVPGAWLAAAVFALHPLHVSSVAWIAERKNVLSALFYLLALDAYMRFGVTQRWRSYAAALLLFVAAVLSKTVAVTLPGAILLIRFYQLKRIPLRDCGLMLPFLIVGVALGLLAMGAESEIIGEQTEAWNETFAERALLIAPRAFWFYAAKTLWPHPLWAVYTRWHIDPADVLQYGYLAGLCAAFAVAGLVWRRRGPAALLLLLFTLGTMLPVLGFVNVYFFRYAYVSTHLQYLASAGFIVLYLLAAREVIGRLTGGAARPTPAVRIASAALLLVLAGRSFVLCFDYRNETVLWERAAADNPQAWTAWVNLGARYLDADRLQDAERVLRRAVEFPPARYEAFGNLGHLYLRQNRPTEAVNAFEQAEEARPEVVENHRDLAYALYKAERYDEALQYARSTLSDARSAYDLMWLGRILSKLNRLDDAREAFREAAALLMQTRQYKRAEALLREALAADEQDVNSWYGLAITLTELGRYQEALSLCQEARKRFAGQNDFLIQAAWIFAVCPDDRIRNAPQALRIARTAVERSQDNPQRLLRALDTLAAAAAATGDFETAVKAASEALEKARERGNEELRTDIEKRLEGYRAGSPYRHSPH